MQLSREQSTGSGRRLPLAIAAALMSALSACTPDITSPSGPSAQYEIVGGGGRAVRTTTELEPIGRHVAAVMRYQPARTFLHEAMIRSRVRERKLHLQPLLKRMDATLQMPNAVRAHLQDAIDLTGGYVQLETYFPVRQQRETWTPASNLQVVVIRNDDDDPIAFDGTGARRMLSKRVPSSQFSLVITQAEQRFRTSGIANAESECEGEGGGGGGGGAALQEQEGGGCCDPENEECEEDPGEGGGGEGGSGGGGGGGGNMVDPDSTSLYMNKLNITDIMEPWTKGEPEIEIHIMARNGTSDSLISRQCAGENQGAYTYAFDYDHAGTDVDWNLVNGHPVLLFTRAQINTYKAAGDALRLIVLEDDDTHCGIRLDGGQFVTMLNDVMAAYPYRNALTDSTINLAKVAIAIPWYVKAITSIYHFFTSKDDIIGTAVTDPTLEAIYPGYNWFIRGEGNADMGRMHLEFK